jgi:exosortase
MATTTAPALPADRPDGPSAPAPPSGLSLLRTAWAHPQTRPALLGAAGCLGLMALIFWPSLQHFAYVWATDENYSHGFLVPLISLYFANEAARRGPTPLRGGAGLGLALLGLALAGRLVTIPVPVPFVSDVSFLLGLAGICSLMAGAGALRRYGFALAFLVFMIPLPVALYSMIASPLQRLASRIASALLNGVGIPVLCEGSMMTLPGDVRMFVAEACSGMRQLTGFLALTTAVAYLTPRPLWYRGLLVASALPIALSANVARVTLTGWIMSHDPRYASGTFHTLEGLLMMGLGLALLRCQCWVLDRLATTPRRPAGGAAAVAGVPGVG